MGLREDLGALDPERMISSWDESTIREGEAEFRAGEDPKANAAMMTQRARDEFPVFDAIREYLLRDVPETTAGVTPELLEGIELAMDVTALIFKEHCDQEEAKNILGA